MSGFVQNGATAAAASAVLNPTITGVTAGNQLFCVYSVAGGQTLSAPTDSSGQTWSLVSYKGHHTEAIAYLLNANAGTHTLTWATQAYHCGGIMEWNGVSALSSAAMATADTSSGTTLTTGNYTPATANELLIGVSSEDGSTSDDEFECTTTGFQSIGSLSDYGGKSCIMVEQNGSSYLGAEGNAQAVSSTSPVTVTYKWSPTVDGSALLQGFTLSAGPAVKPSQFFLSSLAPLAGLGWIIGRRNKLRA
jgi:hypothetical protein